ncbi:hypothetical protein [Acidipropionibacterium jensenii]|uniref:Uncharacterized protein n=1 Tax=Acidipropionibacterium jensenii TaxID=1749 RepID=A0A3S4W6K8_9ACTN|nr:hypothetical protein [Acidipropionibacterium jensenii]AZZ39982.1 hypothetical protein C0Z10_09720 [Acidipropionibacterium jensenii]AZZ41615.1 hypothetical protein C0Z11_04200 [Acidipropionibacterium jensenii]MDN5976887.1 hypothetical protein [Acidipropionibacterium jensenii]MDN5996323.1 hypothetical protein [Acidipropionibacterium jensenii]MDN6426153.1 hypothetical protein [Acidipropionibacterium jensenii]
MTTTSSSQSTSTRGRRPRNRRVLGALAAGVVALTGLTGCLPSSGMAVQVGDQRVSMDTFENDVEACSALANSQTMSPRQVIATTVTQAAVGEELLARSGRTLTTSQRDALMQSNNLTALNASPTCRQLGLRLTSLYAVVQGSDADTLRRQVHSLDVQVNPRLGGWYPDQLLVAGSSSLSSLWAGSRA